MFEHILTLAPVSRSDRKYKCSEHRLFLMRLNVVAGSSNQPWAFNPHFLLFLLSNQQEQSDASVASLSSQTMNTREDMEAQEHE